MTTSRPLAGLRVVEIGHSIAGPAAGSFLAQLGADVVKVENASGGDYARDFGPPYWRGAALNFHALNRDKRGVALDFKSAQDIDRLRTLILEDADVVIQNLRPGSIEKHGIGAADMVGLKPALIYCNIGSYGARGPMKHQPGYDPLMQAFSGIMSITGEQDGAPVRVGVSLIDLGTGMWAVIGILAALQERNKTGAGGIVDASLYETALAWMTMSIADYQASGVVPKRYGSGAPTIVPHQVFKAADGHIIVAAGNDRLFAKLCEEIGSPEWAVDERYASNGARVRNRETLIPLVEARIGERPVREWIAAFDRCGIPCSPMHTVDQVVAHEQTRALEILQKDPGGADMSLVGLPLSFNGVRPPLRTLAPALGEHNGDVFRETAIGSANATL